MNVKRTFSEKIDIAVIVISITLTIGFFLYIYSNKPVESACRADFEFHSFNPDGSESIANGDYLLSYIRRSILKINYTGTMIYKKNDIEINSTPVNRTVIFKISDFGLEPKMEVIHTSRGMGDKTSDSEVMQYIFPDYKHGDIISSDLFILQKTVYASGVQGVPRIICMPLK
jgi:hypothetical protein